MRKRSATLFAFCLYLTLTAHGVASVSEEDVAPEKIERKKHPTPVGCTVTKDPNFNIVSDTLNESTSNGAFSDANANFSIGTGFSAVTPEQDARYMELASKESRTAEEDAELENMVREAARANGYVLKAYHGTGSDRFNVFKYGRAGIYTTPDIDTARTYGDNLLSLYANTNGKQLVVDAKGAMHYEIPIIFIGIDLSEYPYYRNRDTISTDELSNLAFRSLGYDSVVIENVSDDSFIGAGNGKLSTDIVFKDSAQVKSADTVTYNDDREIIPLSERFNSDIGDIRYSLGSGIDRKSDYGYNYFDTSVPITGKKEAVLIP